MQQTLAALVWAKNSKKKCYTGTYQVDCPDRYFKHKDFLAAQAHPGPGSVTTCVLQPHGAVGRTTFLTLEKLTALSQFPGLQYRSEALANLPRLLSWEEHKLLPATVQSIKWVVRGEAVFDPRQTETKEEVIEAMDSRLTALVQYCEEGNILELKDLLEAP